MKAHKFVKKYRAIAWPVCSCCGLVRLRNAATDKAARAACEGREDEK